MLFSYGSNDKRQLAKRLGRRVEPEPGYVRGYRRVFRGFSRKWGGGVASLERHRESITYGALVPIDEEELAILDRYEGVATGNYQRHEATVERPDQEPVLAVVYIATSPEYNEPTRAYLEQIARTVGQMWQSDPPVTWRSFPLR